MSWWWYPSSTNPCSPKFIPTKSTVKMIKVNIRYNVSSLFKILAPCLMILSGRPRAHHEEPMRALHSTMLQYGISDSTKASLDETECAPPKWVSMYWCISDWLHHSCSTKGTCIINSSNCILKLCYGTLHEYVCYTSYCTLCPNNVHCLDMHMQFMCTFYNIIMLVDRNTCNTSTPTYVIINYG